MAEAFTDRELSLLEDRIRESDRGRDSDGVLACPHCEAPLEQRSVSPRSDVSYVRERLWLICGACGRSAVLDRSRGTGEDGGG